MKQFNAASKSYNRSIAKMNKGTSTFTTSASKSFTGLGKSVLSVGTIAGGAALIGITALTAGLIAFGKAAITEGAAYTKAMANVRAISGATTEEFGLLTAAAEELGRTTKFTAIEAAEGMSFLAMAGFEVNDIIGAMPGVLDLAAAGNLDLGKSADIVSNILTGFGADATQTGKFVDVLTKTFTSSNTTLVQLGQAMKFVGPVAADFGLSVEDVSAAMGAMGDAGIQASMAGTGLRTILLRLAAPTGQAKDLIEELGLEIFDAEGKMLPLPKVIGNINKSLEGMSDQQRAATLNTLAGKRAISALSILLEKGEDGLQAFGDELRESGGTAAQIAATQLDNLSGDVTLFQSALSGIKIDVFKALEPLLRDVATAGKGLLETFGPQLVAVFSRISDTISNIISFGQELFAVFQRGGAAGLVEALGLTPETTELISKISQSIQEMGTAITSFFLPGIQELAGGGLLDRINTAIIFLNENFDAFKGAIAGVGAALAGAAIVAILGTIGSVIAAIGAPIILIVAAAAALGAAWATNWLGIRDIVTGVWEKLQPIFETIIEWFETNIPLAVQALSDIWTNNLLPAFTEVGRAIQENLFPIFSQLMDFFRSEGPGAIQALSNIWNNVLLPALMAVGNFILNTLLPIFTTLLVWLIEQIPVGIQRMVNVWNFLKNAFDAVSGFITGTLIPAFSSLITWIRDTLAEAINTAINLWNLFLIPIRAVATFFNDNILPVIQSVANFLDAVLGVALTAMAGLWQNVLLPALQAVWDFINTNILPIFQTVKDTGDEAVGGVAQTIAEIWENTLLPAFDTVWRFIQDNILPIFNTLADIINTVVVVAIDLLSSTISGFIDMALTNLQIGFEAIKDILSEVASFFDGLTESVMNFELPPVLQPGSPTPFEMGLLGVETALGTLGGTFAAFQTAASGAVQGLATSFSIISTQIAVTLPANLALFLETFLLTFEQIILVLVRTIETFTQMNLLIIQISTVSLPQLANSARTTAQVIITGFQQANIVLMATNLLIIEIAANLKRAARAAEDASRAMNDGFKQAAKNIREKLIPALIEAISFMDALRRKAEQATRAAGEAPGVGRAVKEGAGFQAGVGFQAGTPNNVGGALGLGFRIPPGFSGDTFQMRATSGEEVLVTPRGTSIEGLIFSRLANLLSGSSRVRGDIITNNNYEFNMTVNTGASPQAVIGQYEVMRGLVGT